MTTWRPALPILAAGLLVSAAKPAARTLEQLIDAVISGGRETTVEPPVSEALAFSGAVPAKAVAVSARKAADGRSHALYVVYGGSRPVALVWTTAKAAGEPAEGLDVRTDLAGRPTAAVRSPALEPVPPDSPEVARALRRERSLFLGAGFPKEAQR